MIKHEIECYVYIMGRLGDDWQITGSTKIGISNNPIHRLKQVQREEADRLVLVAKFPFWSRAHARQVEAAFHHACRGHRLRGEWFDMTPSDAVGVMSENLKSFINDTLSPADTLELYSARDYVSLPGWPQLCEIESFGHRQ